MNLEPSSDQKMLAESMGRFLDEHSSIARVRAALPGGFDRALWDSLAEMGAFAVRVPEAAGGLDLGLLDAALLMEEAGRTLVSGPIAEAIVAARLIAMLEGPESALLDQVLAGKTVAVIALNDAVQQPAQWVAGGAIADVVLARRGDAVVAIEPGNDRETAPNLASTPIARIKLDGQARTIASGADAVAAFEAAIEEWKLLIASGVAAISRAALGLASAYACERVQFGQPIGTYQAVSHPLADASVDVDGARLAVWKAIRAIADGEQDAAAQVSLAFWLSADSATRAAAQSVHTFGGYGLTLEYDIHLFALRAKAWPLVYGDPRTMLREAADRLYHGATVALPAAGEVSIDLDIGAEAQGLADETRAFMEANLTPELRAKARLGWDGFDAGFHKKTAEAGLLLPAWPPELGGRGVSLYAAKASMEVIEEYGWTVHAQGTVNMVGLVMARFGTDRLKREALAEMIAGDATIALGFSEPGSGSDVFSAATRATRDGDDWLFNGSKMFTSGGEHADYLLMLARTNTEVAKHKGLTMFIVPLKAPGVQIQPVDTFTGETTTITFYDNVRIPDAYRLGEVDGGARVMAASLEIEHGTSFIPNQRRMLAAAVTLARETLRGNRPMIEDPEVAIRLAKIAAHNQASTMLTYRSLWAGVEHKPIPAHGPATKMYTSERYRADSADLLDMFAPATLIDATGPAAAINHAYRLSQLTTVYGGTSEVHRSMIAEKQLGLPRTRA